MRGLFTVILTLLPSVAWSLSCVVPNAGREFNTATQGQRQIVVVSGVLLPPSPTPSRIGKQDFRAVYRIVGTRMDDDGRERRFAEDIVFKSSCVIEWCGPVPDAPVEGVFLLEDGDDRRLTLSTGPCPSGLYQYPGHKIDAFRSCVSQGQCGDSELRTLDYSNR